MIETYAEVLGGQELARQMDTIGSDIRRETRAALEEFASDVVERAKANAPKRTGVMADRITYYFGRPLSRGQARRRGGSRFVETGDVEVTIRPTGTIAHLIERGPQTGKRKQHVRRVQRRAAIWTRKGRKVKSFRADTIVKEHAFRWSFKPFFMPAFEALGGFSGAMDRLRAAIDRVIGRRAA